MQENDFDKLEKKCEFTECDHEVVKLYTLGSHDGYGCTKCKRRFPSKEYFDNNKTL